MHDVIVVGAGPAGSYTARLLEKMGLDVVVIERKSEVGLPVQCSGLVSKNLDRFVKVPKEIIEHEVKRAVIHGPGKDINLKKSSTAAYVLDREGFDMFMVSKIESTVKYDTEVRGISMNKDSVSVNTSKGEFQAKALVGADGPGSIVRKHFRVTPPEFVSGIYAMTEERDSSDFVELWLERKICDGFLWRIPRKDRVEYGMLGTKAKFPQLEKFFKLKSYTRGAGTIPLGSCKSFFPRTLLVGDAAAMTKPWSGGGVVYSLTAAGHAARTIAQGIKEGNLSESLLEGYEKAWKDDFGNQISLGMMGRELFKDMSETQFKEVFDKLANQDLNSLDMDFPVFSL